MRERTMLWQKASARTVAVMIPSAPRTRLSSCRVRIVVAPSRFLQYAAKSCSPSRPCAASFIASTSRGQSCQRTWWRSSGSTPPGLSVTRYAYRRQIAEKRASKPGGASRRAHTRTSLGSRPASRLSSFSWCSRHTPSGRSTCATWPRACTPASVRPATVSSYVSFDRVTVRRASSISPCTVRRPPACLAHPEKPVPS
jgi:hypothetical protein